MKRFAGVPTWIVACGALAEILFGYDTGIIAAALIPISEEFALTPAAQGSVVSALLLGAALGVLSGGWLADRIGRRLALLLTAAVFTAGGAGAALVDTVDQLIAARFVIGLAVGSSAVVASVYLVEIAPAHARGTIGATGQLMVALGVVLSYVVGYALEPADAWRWMLGLSVIPAVAFGVAVWFLPETPRHLLRRANRDQAAAALRRLRPEAGDLEAELDAIARSTTRPLPRRLLFSGSQRRRTVAGFGLAILVQLLGVNAITYFAPLTLVRSGFTEHGAVAANLAIGTIGLACTILGMTIVDRFDRRHLLMCGCAGMALASSGLAALNHLTLPSRGESWATLGCMVIFLVAFASTWGVALRVIVSELFPGRARGAAVGAALSLNWLTNFAVAKTFPSLLATNAVACYLGFATVGVLALLFVRWVVPETGRGLTLEQINENQIA